MDQHFTAAFSALFTQNQTRRAQKVVSERAIIVLGFEVICRAILSSKLNKSFFLPPGPKPPYDSCSLFTANGTRIRATTTLSVHFSAFWFCISLFQTNKKRRRTREGDDFLAVVIPPPPPTATIIISTRGFHAVNVANLLFVLSEG
jgi:hypothetical protein